MKLAEYGSKHLTDDDSRENGISRNAKCNVTKHTRINEKQLHDKLSDIPDFVLDRTFFR